MIAPPGQLKTTTILSLEAYSEVLASSDINIRSMKSVRDQVLGGQFKTLAFAEMEKLYARNPATASNIEAHLKLFAEDGLRHFSHEDPASAIMPARALIVLGLTPSTFGQQIGAWRENGFLRRFLRMQWVLKDERSLIEAVHQWKKIGFEIPTVFNGRIQIPYSLTLKESARLVTMLKYQSNTTPLALLKRTACVLKKREPKNWEKIIDDIAPSFGQRGALLEL
jgi:hypothetical protein